MKSNLGYNACVMIPSWQPGPLPCICVFSLSVLVFELQPTTYGSDRAKIAYVLGLLTGRARAWGMAFWHNPLTTDSTFEPTEMLSVFDHPITSHDVSKQLLSLRHGQSSATNYSVKFRTLAVELEWDDGALQSIFLKGLNNTVRDCLVGRVGMGSLQELIALAIKIDNRLRERRRERVLTPAASGSAVSSAAAINSFPQGLSKAKTGHLTQPISSTGQEEPKKLGCQQLTWAERSRHFKEGLCICCGKPGHQLAKCTLLLNSTTHQLQPGFW